MLSIRPLGDRVIIEPEVAECVSPGGIILPDSSKKRPDTGVILAVGPGRYLDNGQRRAMDVKVGDRVQYSKYGGDSIEVDGRDVVILDVDQIFVVLGPSN